MSGGTWHPDGCRCSGCRPVRNAPTTVPPPIPRAQPGTKNGGDRPVYRYPPRSHAGNCPCDRCAPFRRNSGGGIGILIPAFLLFLFGFWPFIVWHGCKYSDGTGLSACGSGSEWTWTGQTWAACGIWWGIIALGTGLAVADKAAKKKALGTQRRPRPPKGRLRVEATPQPSFPSAPLVPAPPVCLHRNAVRVETQYLGEKILHRCWCPDCDPEGKTPLPANFRFPCCGGEPAGLPGEGHLYNCPHTRQAPRPAVPAAREPGMRDLGRCPGCGQLVEKTPGGRFPFFHTATGDFACPPRRPS